MYRFQISAHTQVGESIALVGSIPEFGQWDVIRCVRLRTSGDRYPLWWSDLEIDLDPWLASVHPPRIEYKYVRLSSDGSVVWEASETNRWLPIEPVTPPSILVIDDGDFGKVQPYPYGYLHPPEIKTPLTQTEQGLKIVVIGSSVALGCNAWRLQGWADILGQKLHQRYGHQLVNVSEIGANVSTTIDRFPLVVTPEQPDVVIIALSLGNEGLAYCPPSQRRAVQRRFESELQQLLKMTRELGARPILGGVYPHGDYFSEHYGLLRETHSRMLKWGVPVLNWLAAVDDGTGRWQTELCFNAAHPNSEGHRLMAEAIDLNFFQISKDELAQEKLLPDQVEAVLIFRDDWGFHLFVRSDKQSLRVINPSKHSYTISPSWQALQTALQIKAVLLPGIYISKNAQPGTQTFFSVGADGAIETTIDIPPASDLEYRAAFNFFSPPASQVLFHDGQLGILKENEQLLRVINESDHDYNIQPMWQEVSQALKAMPTGVYSDPVYPDAAFRTLMIGRNGLESRVKAPPQSSMLLQYHCKLSDVSRIAILPLGDRCAIRMLLYKMEYDGPAFPFDLTRSTKLGDVADMIATGFDDMWNPDLLHYEHDHRRVYHKKWTGLSFAHEVEEEDDPANDMTPVHKRMRTRYTARAERFWYTLRHCDKVLFVRTGLTDRGSVVDLVAKLEARCQGKPFRLLLISPQPSDEFADLASVLHYNLEFNPDRMYEDLGYWLYCTDLMRGILTDLGVSSQNLFWCPPKTPKSAS